MKIQHSLRKIVLAACLTAATSSTGGTAFAQSFYYYPSASFFSPAAFYYESDEIADLAMTLEGDKFATFNRNLQQTELTKVLEREKVMTVLAPTEKAFAALSPEQKEKLSDPETLKKVLQYHLIVGNIDEEDIKRRGVATLLEQNSVNITGVQEKDNRVTVMLNDAVASEPLPAENGVVIPIDRVLIPPNF